MSEKPDTVPGLGFKDKDKAQETIKNLLGRDPDYQKLAIKGLVGRAKRTLTLTKDKEKLQNINDAIGIFTDWLAEFETSNRSKENRAYLPLPAITNLLPLKEELQLEDSEADAFYAAYAKAKGEYKNLRTVPSGENEPTWDIVRNRQLKKLLDEQQDQELDLWDGDLPSKEHLRLILWAYSPDASKIKKSVEKFEEKFGHRKRKSSGEESGDDSPSKKKKKTKE